MSIHEEIYKGYTITIEQDEYPDNPDVWNEFDQVFMQSMHHQFYVEFPKQVNKRNLRLNWWVLPLYAYIHSGVALSLDNTRYPYNDQWDACQVGYVFVKRGRLSGKSREQALGTAQRYIDEWNMFLDGNIYGYVIEAPENDSHYIESICGFYAEDWEEVLREARESVDHRVDQ